jgi:endonuclease G, mitochondrial
MSNRSGQNWMRWCWVSRLLISALTLWMLVGCTSLIQQVNRSFGNPNLVLGNPSAAIASADSADNYLISKPQYALSYNRDKGIPNWVSWQLNAAWLGTLPRPPFATDTSLPDSWYRVSPDDYTGSGFDRGHMIPAADRNHNPNDSQAVFLMTNIFPQAPDNNRGPWEQLESDCRAWVKKGKELYIIAGIAGSGGIGERGKRDIIGRGKVTVPASTWKVVVILDRPGLGLLDVTASTRVIAVNLPNQQGIKERNWQEFQTSVDKIEALTGYDLLSNVPPAIQTTLEAGVGS